MVSINIIHLVNDLDSLSLVSHKRYAQETKGQQRLNHNETEDLDVPR